MILIPHLEPSTNSGNKIVVSARCRDYVGYDNINSTQTNEFIIAEGNITDFSVTAEPTRNQSSLNGYKIHFAYRKDGRIYYRADIIAICSAYPGSAICRDSFVGLEEISSGDAVTHRYTPDISLRNGLPVIVYQGETPVSTAIQYEEGEAIYLNYTKYPIVEKYKEQGGNWSIFWKHQAPMFSTQQNPTTEGSKNAYAHLMNYSVNNTLFKKFVRIDGLSGYGCSPATFSGKDAKFVRGSYIGQLGSYLGVYSHPMLLTLSTEAPLYIIGKQEFNITNAIQNDVFNNIAGVIEMNDLYYKFTLGPLFANNQITFDDGSPPENVQTIIEFNDEMVSEVFMMSDYDTLILGANGCYQGDQTSPFEIIRYDVNLVNNTTGETHRLLFHDTVNVEDSTEIEFLRGFVIEDIPNGSDSFYVELVVNPDDIAGDEDYGMGGDYDGGDGGGDNPLPYKKKVFFEGDNITGNTTTPKEYSLSQNYPNPFNPTTTINYDLPKDGNVKLIIYDILGREVSKLVNNEFKVAGRYSVVFDGSSLSSGIYFYRIEVNNGKDFMKVKRMVLVK